MCGIICCGVATINRTLNSAPDDYPTPPKNIVCPFCSFKGDSVYRRKDIWFTLFFIPIFPVKREQAYVSCSSCGTMLGKYGTFMCKNCRAAAPQSFSHCVRCGMDLTEDGNRVQT